MKTKEVVVICACLIITGCLIKACLAKPIANQDDPETIGGAKRSSGTLINHALEEIKFNPATLSVSWNKLPGIHGYICAVYPVYPKNGKPVDFPTLQSSVSVNTLSPGTYKVNVSVEDQHIVSRDIKIEIPAVKNSSK